MFRLLLFFKIWKSKDISGSHQCMKTQNQSVGTNDRSSTFPRTALAPMHTCTSMSRWRPASGLQTNPQNNEVCWEYKPMENLSQVQAVTAHEMLAHSGWVGRFWGWIVRVTWLFCASVSHLWNRYEATRIHCVNTYKVLRTVPAAQTVIYY